jgi:hypothetical protein
VDQYLTLVLVDLLNLGRKPLVTVVVDPENTRSTLSGGFKNEISKRNDDELKQGILKGEVSLYH